MPAPTSKAQARLFGAVAAGEVKKDGLSADEARRRLTGVDLSKLPERAGSARTKKLRHKELRRKRFTEAFLKTI